MKNTSRRSRRHSTETPLEAALAAVGMVLTIGGLIALLILIDAAQAGVIA